MITKFWLYAASGNSKECDWHIETSMDLRFDVDEYGREKLRKQLISFFSEVYCEVVWIEFDDERETTWIKQEII